MDADVRKASSSRLCSAVGVNVHKWNEILCMPLVSGVWAKATEECYGKLCYRCL